MDPLLPIWNRIPLLILVFIRVGALLFSVPILGAKRIPTPARVGLACALSWGILPLVPLPTEGPAFDLVWWGGSVVREALIGLSMGVLAHLCLAAVPLAGQLVGYQMGFGIANVVDPVGQRQMSVIATFFNLMVLWLFLALNGHHLLIVAIFRSFEWMPPGTGWLHEGLGELALEGGRQLFRSALLLAAPIMLILLCVKVGLGLVARTVPQMNVFIVALPLQIGVGLVALGTALGVFAPWVARSLKWLDGIYALLGRGF
jgi:flagellar biosynthetic protein FliR